MTTADQAKILSGAAASIALVLSLFVSFFVVQSISAPLKQLTRGTRAIAEGKFFYRLDTSHRDEFSQLAKDFNTMTERLNDLDRMKRDFVAHVSHELKSPLASMQETVQALLDLVPGELTEKQQRLLELNLQNGRRLSSLIRNLLDMSRMEAGVMEYDLRGNNLAALMKIAVDETEALAGEKQIRLRTEAPPNPLEGMCDGDRVIQVVKNLLSNAVKFSPNRSDIEVRLHAVREVPEGVPAARCECLRRSAADGFALLEVIDSGIGVPDEHKEKIFEKFHQVKQGKKIPGQGAGLGLAISWTIAEAHGGAIWVEDNSSGGSTFKVVLPLAGRSPETARGASAPIG